MNLILETDNQILENKIKMIAYWTERENLDAQASARHFEIYLPECEVEFHPGAGGGAGAIFLTDFARPLSPCAGIFF